jgi:hypothetical protein
MRPFLTPLFLQIHYFFFGCQTSSLLSAYSRNLQEKKSHLEVRSVREILRSFLDEMIAADPKDVGAPSEFWHPGELCPALYPNMDKARFYPLETLTGMFPVEYIDKYWEENPLDGLWKLGDGKDSKTLFGWLFKPQPGGYNARWLWQYRKKILEAFLGDDTQYLDLLLEYGKTKFTNTQKRNALEIIMHAFTKRSHNGVYAPKDGNPIVEQPRTLISFVLLVSDFVFSLGTMKTLHLLLSRDFSPHTTLGCKFDSNLASEDQLSPDYRPLHDYPKPGYLINDARFILEAFLHPQSILGKGLTDLILGVGNGRHRYKNHMYRDKANLMISAQWLNIVNLLGYIARPTDYMKKCFPTVVEGLTNFRKDTQISNLREFATMLNELLFGENSLFKINPDDFSFWESHCTPNKNEPFMGDKENWVKQPWVHFSLRKEDIQNQNHPFYLIRERKLTMTNIVEWLFLGKMWQTDESPANYSKSNPPFYHDDTFNWGEEPYCPLRYTFCPFNESELDADKKDDDDDDFVDEEEDEEGMETEVVIEEPA